MKQIAEKLWQGSAMLGYEMPEDIEVVFWLCGGWADLRDEPQIWIYYTIPDNPEGLDKTTFFKLWQLVNTFAGCSILTVCAAGENRSGLVAAMTLIARGMEVEEAIKTVQVNGNSNTHDHSFWNPGFVRQVREWLA